MDESTCLEPNRKEPKQPFNDAAALTHEEKPESSRKQIPPVPEQIRKDVPAPKLVPKGSLQPIREQVDKKERERAAYLKALNRIRSNKRSITNEFSPLR